MKIFNLLGLSNIIQFVHSHVLNMSRVDFWWDFEFTVWRGGGKGCSSFQPPSMMPKQW